MLGAVVPEKSLKKKKSLHTDTHTHRVKHCYGGDENYISSIHILYALGITIHTSYAGSINMNIFWVEIRALSRALSAVWETVL